MSVICLSTALSLAFCCPISTHTTTKIRNYEAEENVKKEQLNDGNEATIYTDSAGNYVFHNISPAAAKTVQKVKFADETKEVREELINQPEAMSSYTYDIENNPIYIGTWNGEDGYARHTLGKQTTSNGKKYLTSTGDATWYNHNRYVALPYRNGNSTVREHMGKVDVAKGTSFKVTNPDTGKSVNVVVDDFGPQQNTSPGKKTIVDLDSERFTTLFGDTAIGRHVCKTKVQVKQYYN